MLASLECRGSCCMRCSVVHKTRSSPTSQTLSQPSVQHTLKSHTLLNHHFTCPRTQQLCLGGHSVRFSPESPTFSSHQYGSLAVSEAVCTGSVSRNLIDVTCCIPRFKKKTISQVLSLYIMVHQTCKLQYKENRFSYISIIFVCDQNQLLFPHQ